MHRWKLCLPVLLGVTAVALSLWGLPPWLHSAAGRSSPRHFDEVVVVARELGLNYQGDCEDGSVQTRLVVSEFPLSWERANALSVGRKENTDWVGIVAVFQGLKVHPEVHGMRPWGNFLLCGDPALIQKLTGRTASPDD